MADKVQNVLVNFKFNTAELEKATQLTNRANEASNRLQETAKNAGRGAAQSYSSATDQLRKLTAEQKRLEDAIKGLKSSAFPTIKAYAQALQPLSAQYAKIKSEIDKVNKSLRDQEKELKNVSNQTKGLAENFGQLANAVKLALTAGIAREVVSTALEFERLAGNVEGVDRAFNRAFPGAQALLSELKTATHGTVSEFELMQRTLQATNLGVGVQELPVLFEFAATRAQQTGESVDYLVDSIVRGIGRKSLLVLDNLGLSATRLKEQFDGASLASQSVGDVTRGAAAIARVELAKMGGYAENAATKVDGLASSWQNLRSEIAKSFEDGTVATFLKGFVDSFQTALEARQRGISIQELAIERTNQEAAALRLNSLVNERFTESKENNIKVLEEESEAIKRQIGFLASERDVNDAAIKENERLENSIRSQIAQGKLSTRSGMDQIKWLIEYTKEIKASTEARMEDVKVEQEYYKLLQSKLLLLKDEAQEEKVSTGIIQRKREEIEKIQKAIEETNRSSDISSRLGVGKLITDLAVAQAELKELLEGPENKEFKIVPNKVEATKEFEKLVKLLEGIPVNLKVLPPSAGTIPMDFWDELGEAVNQNQQELMDTGLGIFTDQLISFEEAEVASLQNRLNNLRNFYDEQQILAGDNEKAKQELRLKEERESAALQKKIAQKEKEARRFSVLVNTAAGIVRAYAENPFPLATLYSGIIAAQGASQLAIINRTQARFKDGVINLKGPGTGTSDSIHARLSRGESVMTAKETQGSMGILKDIRAKKLDDRVLKDLKLSSAGVSYSGLDDSRILAELQKIREGQPDIVSQSGKLYQMHSKGKSYKVKSRISAMGY